MPKEICPSLVDIKKEAWYGSCSAHDRKKLQQVMNVAQSIMQTIDSVYTSCCLGKATSIIKDRMHPGHSLFYLLPLGEKKIQKSEVTYQPTEEQLLPCCHQTFEWTYLALI